eukprot:TRINITY_DN14315_c0_g1_i5.p1 TRINITY_DN14315_c0_g1~~TRINITY_DN14315_c0_g1_i5.p1  ORF type:complete len:377 (-),score=92.81 TRINITY_DN14315_c0_g1_i5:79-1188(-)
MAMARTSVLLALTLSTLCTSCTPVFSRDLNGGESRGLNLKDSDEAKDKRLSARSRAEAIVEIVNNHQNVGWVAEINPRFKDATLAEVRASLGAFLSPPPADGLDESDVLEMPREDALVDEIYFDVPPQFDARKKWPHCGSLFEIRDQGHCGSCWAFGAVEALSDRFCVQANVSVSLSAEDVLSCCGFWCGKGCDGGYPFRAWHYFVHRGVVSSSCLPYFDQDGCKHPNCEPVAPTPKCQRLCASGEKLQLEKYYARNAYYIFPPTQKNIMREVFLNGPIEVAFTVYEDFIYYKSGVYRHVQGGVVGGHAVKLIGWGTTEDGVDYWLLVNQWNRSWGEDGLFRYIRGINEGGLETSAVAGMVDLRRSKII